MSDDRPDRPEDHDPRDPDTPAHDAPAEPFVEESEEIDLSDVDGEPPAERVSAATAAMRAAGTPPTADDGEPVHDAAEVGDEPVDDAAVDDAAVDDEASDHPDAPDLDEPGVAVVDDHADDPDLDDAPTLDDEADLDEDDEDDLDRDADLASPPVVPGDDHASHEHDPSDEHDPVDDHPSVDEPRDDRPDWLFGSAAGAAAFASDDGDGPAPAGPEEQRRRRRWPILLGAVVVLGALYVAGWFLTGTRLPADVTVAGVQLGGMSTAEARQTLEDELLPREDEPVRLVSGEESFEIVPDDVGLALDVDASVDRAGGTRSWDPRDILALVVGSSEHAAAVDVDDAGLDSAVQAIAETVDVPVTEALITFPDEKPTPREPKDGRVVLKDDTARLVQDEYLVQDEPAEVPMTDEQPVVDSEGLARAVTEIGEPAVSAPVMIDAGGEDVELPVTAYAPALTVEPVDGVMTPVIDPEELAEPLTDATTGIGEQAVDASFEIKDGKPVVVPGKEGLGLQPEEMAEVLPRVLTEQGDARTVKVEAKVVQPAFTTEDAEKLGITEKISEFTTQYPHAEYRNVNQSRGAALIDGTVLKPGETFSFNDTVGERTAANGFTSGSVINGGRFVDELGGGVSQVVTTTYNAAFFAGLEDVEHHPHAFYIDRYPEGREATVYFGSLDLRFKNTLENGVLITAFVQKSSPGGVGRTTVQMWGTKQYDVEAGKSERRNERSPKTRYDDADDCVPQAPLGGFDVDIYRTISQGGKVVKRETDTAVYQAADRIVCGKDPADD